MAYVFPNILVAIVTVALVAVMARTLDGPLLFLPATAVVVLAAVRAMQKIDSVLGNRRHPPRSDEP